MCELCGKFKREGKIDEKVMRKNIIKVINDRIELAVEIIEKFQNEVEDLAKQKKIISEGSEWVKSDQLITGKTATPPKD